MVLQAIRERLSGIIAIFIFAILIIPFAFVGVNSYFTSDAVNSVARVNEEDITVSDFAQGFQNYRRRMQARMGENFDAEQFDQPMIRRQYLDSMIDQELLIQVSEEAGLSVDNESLALAIREIPAFQVDGEFNTDVYQARLTAQGTSPQRFEVDMRAQLILDQFPGAITSSAIATDWELNHFVQLLDQQRAFKAIMVPAAVEPVMDPEAIVNDEAPVDTPAENSDGDALASAEGESAESDDAASLSNEPGEEAAVLAWYESHPQLYRSIEQVVIEYLELDAAAMEEETEPDEDQLRARFEEQKARFITPESRLASHILIEVAPEADDATIETARQLAEDLAERARQGEEFEALAAEYSQDTGSAQLGGDLGWVEPGFMVQAFEEGLYALSLDQAISEPVQTGFGWHVIFLRDIRPAEGMSYDEARDILLAEYYAELQERKFIEQADRLVDLIYEDPTTLEAASEVLGLEIQQAGPFSRAGGTGIAANQAVINASFSDLVLQQGVVSDPIELAENHIILVRVREHMPESLLPLDEVRDRVFASVRQDRAMQVASSRAEELLALLQDGVDIVALAETQSLELLQSETARRGGGTFPQELVRQVFLLQAPLPEAVSTAVVPTDTGYAVVQLERVMDGVLPADDESREQAYRRRIANSTANSEAMGFLRMLRAQSEIEVYEDRL